VGYEAKVYSPVELKVRLSINKSLHKVQLNTSGLRDRAIEAIGPDEFFRRQEAAWKRYHEEGGLGSLDLKSLRGVEGPEGIEGAWSDLCGRKVPPNTGIVVDLSKQ
jgi:hypothetical protein